MIRFSKEQMTTLAKYEDRLGTAYRAQWCRAMQKADYEEVYQVWQAASGESLEHNANCGSCVLHLMSRVGAAYFAQKDAEAQVKTSKVKATAQRSVKVKTSK